jgi:hypothetical protein
MCAAGVSFRLLLQPALCAISDRLPLGLGVVGVTAHLLAPFHRGVVVVVGDDGDVHPDVFEGPDPPPEGTALAADHTAVRHDHDVEGPWDLLCVLHQTFQITTMGRFQGARDSLILVCSDVRPLLDRDVAEGLPALKPTVLNTVIVTCHPSCSATAQQDLTEPPSTTSPRCRVRLVCPAELGDAERDVPSR